jgi:phenylacetate-coenzyme A ligase PaaK-like adenylate-forming protein
VIASLPRRLYGSAVVARALRGQKGVPFASRERIEQLRDRRVRRLVAHAARTVPFYRDLLAREGIDPREIRTAGDLSRLPVLDKDLVRSSPDLFLSESRAGRTSLSFLTSGSTGAAMRVHHDRRSVLENIAYGERERGPVIAGCGGSFRPKEVYVGNETSVMKDVQAFYADATMMPARPRRRFVSVRESVESVAAILDEERPDLLTGYGGWIHLFFKTAAARGLEFHRPKMVMYMAEALPPGGRELIEDDFGVAVMSRYSAAEAFKIGFYCEERTGFHLHEDLCHVRVLGEDGEEVAEGEPGRLVISNLVNRASVLLNYPIGDVGSVAADPCPCGRTFTSLAELEGRVEDVITFDDGRFVHPRAVWQVFKDDADVLQYQLVQHDPRRYDLTLTTLDDEAFDRALERARPELAALLGGEARLDATRRSHQAGRGDRKFRAVASLYRPAETRSA